MNPITGVIRDLGRQPVASGIFRLDRRVIPEENPAEVEAKLRERIAACARHNPQIKVEVRQLLLAEPLTPQQGTDRIAAAIQRHSKQILTPAAT